MVDLPDMDHGLNAGVAAGWVTGQYLLAVLFARWLSRHPERQRPAAFITTGLLVLALVSGLVQVLKAPSLITSPLMPDNFATFMQLQHAVRAVPVVLGLCVAIFFCAKHQWMHVVIASLATYGLLILWDILYLLMPAQVRSFGMF